MPAADPTRSLVLWHTTISLDGYVAGPDDDLGWVFDHFDPADPAAAAVVARTGAVVAGRRSYEAGRRDGREVFDGAWDGPQFLLTTRPVDDLPSGVAVRAGDVRPVVEEARAAADGRDVLLIGADVARRCVEAGVVDEVIVHVAPVLLGDGVRFQGPPGRRDLEPVAVSHQGTVTTLRFRLPR